VLQTFKIMNKKELKQVNEALYKNRPKIHKSEVRLYLTKQKFTNVDEQKRKLYEEMDK